MIDFVLLVFIILSYDFPFCLSTFYGFWTLSELGCYLLMTRNDTKFVILNFF